MAKRRKDKFEDETLVNVVEVKDSAQDYFERNKTIVMSVIAAIVLAVGAFIVYKYFIKEPREMQAKVAIYKAEQQFAQDSFALALENPGGGFEGLLDVIDNYSGTATANLAKLYAGISYLNLGRYEDAISYYSSHNASSFYSRILKNGGLGDAYSETGDFDKALSFYDKAVNSGNDDLLTPYYLYKQGLLAKRTGDNNKARTSFERIRDEYPGSNEANNIALMIANLSDS
ncbi:MAG: tetratricopeptide repeat protein [Saprospiraceae bacterium]|nr:tetratricopeptide repeat protein [Bacteroidia bacterium]NNF23169.1 tetratricopeptide repeat protein [Saprospiraceae bacterium]